MIHSFVSYQRKMYCLHKQGRIIISFLGKLVLIQISLHDHIFDQNVSRGMALHKCTKTKKLVYPPKVNISWKYIWVDSGKLGYRFHLLAE